MIEIIFLQTCGFKKCASVDVAAIFTRTYKQSSSFKMILTLKTTHLPYTQTHIPLYPRHLLYLLCV